MATSDEIEHKHWLSFIEQIITDAAGSRATEVLFRPDKSRVQTFFLIDGQFEKGNALPMTSWPFVHQILKSDYFNCGQYNFYFQGSLVIFDCIEEPGGVVHLKLTRQPLIDKRRDGIEDIFSSFEDTTWDSIKSIFLSILNLALEQHYNGIVMELTGQVVNICYYFDDQGKTRMTISSDIYDALSRLIGENYLAFGFMTREFREKEYLIRLQELNEDMVAPKIRLEIEELV